MWLPFQILKISFSLESTHRIYADNDCMRLAIMQNNFADI